MKKFQEGLKESVPLAALLEATPTLEVEARDADQRTPLFWACSEGREDVVAYLLQKGASPNVQDDEQWTPLQVATSKGNEPIVKLLLSKGADPNLQNSSKSTAIHYAASKGHEEVLLALLSSEKVNLELKDASGSTALGRAASRGNIGCVKLLLTKGADVCATDNDGNTALHLAVAEQFAEVAFLLKGAIHVKNKKGESALSLATPKMRSAFEVLAKEEEED